MNRGRLFAASILVCLAGLGPAQEASSQKAAPQTSARQVFGPVYSANLPQPDNGPSLDSIRGTVMKLRGATLEIGLQDGGVALFDVATKERTLDIPGEDVAPTKDVTMLGNRAWWIVSGGQFLRTAGPGMTKAYEIDLSDSGLEG